MAPSIHEPVGGRRSGEKERQETRFERAPWVHVTYGERKNPQVTMWIGFKAIVVALSFPDGSPEDIRISITGTCLQIRGVAQSDLVSQEINLPCPVETRAIRIEDRRGTIYILLQKK